MKTVLDKASLMAINPTLAPRDPIMATKGVAEQAKIAFVFGVDSSSALSIMTLHAAAPINTSTALNGEKRTELKYNQFGCVLADMTPSMNLHAFKSYEYANFAKRETITNTLNAARTCFRLARRLRAARTVTPPNKDERAQNHDGAFHNSACIGNHDCVSVNVINPCTAAATGPL